MVRNGQPQVGDGHHDGDLVLGNQQPHQASLEHICGEEGEKDNNQRENQADILNTETENVHISIIESHTLTHTNITNRITLSNLNSSQKVLIMRSTNKKQYCTSSMERYLVRESFILSHVPNMYGIAGC